MKTIRQTVMLLVLSGLLPSMLWAQRSTATRSKKREYFYWALHERFFQQALRAGDWKAVRPANDKPIELYNLKTDPAETMNLADKHPEPLQKLTALMQSARNDSSDWPIKAPPEKK